MGDRKRADPICRCGDAKPKTKKTSKTCVAPVRAFRQDTPGQDSVAPLCVGDERLSKINAALLSLDEDYDKNVNRLTSLCGELLDATCALYNRLEGKMLCSLGQWNSPEDYQSEDSPEGHICFDVIRRGSLDPLLVRNLPDSGYADTDPNVRKYDLKTYLGHPVMCGDKAVGSLCVVYTTDITLCEHDMLIIKNIALALGREEGRKRAMDELLRSEEKYRLVAENSLDVIWIIDLSGKYTFVSPSTLSFSGFTPEESLALSIEDILVPESLEKAKRLLAEELGKPASERVPSLKLELRQHHKDGRIIDFEATMKWLYDDIGNLIGIQGTSRDITERKKTERALRESEKRLRVAGEVAYDLIYEWDVDSDSLEWFGDIDRLLGRSEGEISQDINAWLNLIHPDDRGILEEAVERHRISTDPIQYEYRVMHVDGSYRYFEDHALPMVENGIPHKWVGVCTDITDRKMAEIEKGLAAVGRVAGKMAHDFNNALAGILGTAQLLLMQEDLSPDIRRDLNTIVDAAMRGKGLTDQLSAFSRDKEPNLSYFVLDSCVDTVLDSVRSNLTGVAITKQYHAVPKLIGDRGMVGNALHNFIQNSLHAMSKTTNPKLTIRIYSESDWVFCEIIDNGCGIPKEFLEKVFEPAVTLKGGMDSASHYDREIKGTGYGMCNAKRSILKNGGNLTLESEVGKGTVVRFSLPIPKEELTPSERQVVRQDEFISGKRILVVEDEAVIRRILYGVLTGDPLHHIIDAVEDGQMALDRLRRGEYDVVSLDYILPGVSGMQVYKKIRETHPHLPILFVSGNLEFESNISLLRASDPYVDFLKKPFDNMAYIRKINACLRLAQQ